MKDVHSFIGEVLMNTASSETLIAYDVDVTLTVCDDPHTHMPNVSRHKDIFDDLFKDMHFEKIDKIWGELLQNTKPVLIDERTPEMIDILQKNGSKVIALTAIVSGESNYDDSHEVKRFKDLKSVGFDFSSSFPKNSSVKLTDIPPYMGNHPVFYNGILISNGEGMDKNTKGPALISFLKKIGWKPKSVILIDDKTPNFVSVRNSLECYDNSIDFHGIHYTGGIDFITNHVEEDTFRDFWKQVISKID